MDVGGEFGVESVVDDDVVDFGVEGIEYVVVVGVCFGCEFVLFEGVDEGVGVFVD